MKHRWVELTIEHMRTVSWCTRCGAVKIEEVVDGVLMTGYAGVGHRLSRDEDGELAIQAMEEEPPCAQKLAVGKGKL